MFRFHRTADMLSDVSRLLAFAADELRDCARAASVADERACAAIDQADMLQRQLDRLLGQRPELAPTPVPVPAPVPGPLPMPECRDEGQAPTAADDAPEGLPAADVPPLDAPASAASTSTRSRGSRRRKGDGEAPASASGQAPDAATEAEAVEQVAQVLGDAPVPVPAPSAPRDVSADLFGPAPGTGPADDDFPPL